MPYALEGLGIVSALGIGQIETRFFLNSEKQNDLSSWPLLTRDASVPTGSVVQNLSSIPDKFQHFNCRNHRIAMMALQQILPIIEQAKTKFNSNRIGIVVGSSTSGMDASENAFRSKLRGHGIPKQYSYSNQHEMGSISQMIATTLGITGPAYTVSTACTSSAKAFASAKSLLKCGICDAVIIGGVDTLCDLTIHGFEALASLANNRCNPFSINRDGLNIGEGAAFFVMTQGDAPVYLCGVGESSDAWHISAPHPQAVGAQASISMALMDAKINACDIDYINLHGTGTPLNDAMEAIAISKIFGNETLCSSTKPLSGHCLGAAGAIEAAFCWLGLNQEHSIVPIHHWDGLRDPQLPDIRLSNIRDCHSKGQYWISNSFAFGGSNCSLIFGSKP